MLANLILLGLLVNLEPTRIGFLPLLLARERPLIQLLAFLTGSLSVSLISGTLILLAFQHNPVGSLESRGGQVQIAIGVIVLMIASLIGMRWVYRKNSANLTRANLEGSLPDAQLSRANKFTGGVRILLGKGRSPWVSGLVGMGSGLPSIDYLAVLAIIATSQTTPTQKMVALITFVLLGSLVMIAPLLAYLMSPVKTLAIVEQFGAWVRSRSQIEYAALLAVAGCLLIGLAP